MVRNFFCLILLIMVRYYCSFPKSRQKQIILKFTKRKNRNKNMYTHRFNQKQNEKKKPKMGEDTRVNMER